MKLRQHITLLRCRHEDDVMRKNSSRLFMLLELKIVYIRYSIFCTCVLLKSVRVLHTYSYSSCMPFLKELSSKIVLYYKYTCVCILRQFQSFPIFTFFRQQKDQMKVFSKKRRLKTNALFSAYDIHHRFYIMTFSLSNKIHVCRLSRIYCTG